MTYKFQKDFLWGTATAAHQVEGGNFQNDFWALEHVPDTIFLEPSGDACDHYHRYREDIAMLAFPWIQYVPLFNRMGACRTGRWFFLTGSHRPLPPDADCLPRAQPQTTGHPPPLHHAALGDAVGRVGGSRDMPTALPVTANGLPVTWEI